jgi:hypothetical protein
VAHRRRPCPERGPSKRAVLRRRPAVEAPAPGGDRPFEASATLQAAPSATGKPSGRCRRPAPLRAAPSEPLAGVGVRLGREVIRSIPGWTCTVGQWCLWRLTNPIPNQDSVRRRRSPWRPCSWPRTQPTTAAPRRLTRKSDPTCVTATAPPAVAAVPRSPPRTVRPLPSQRRGRQVARRHPLVVVPGSRATVAAAAGRA